MGFNHGLTAAQKIDNDSLTSLFGCSDQGGMRRSHKTNTLVLVSDHTKSLYEDRWEGNVFHYTGMGRVGDQSLNYSQNRTLNESRHNGIEVYLFEVFESKQYTFIGQVELSGTPYQENQLDDNNDLRTVWVFPLTLISNKRPKVFPESVLIKKQQIREKKARKLDENTLAKRAKHARKHASSRKAVTKVYDRDPYVSEFAKRRAKGVCDLCKNPAPFTNKDGQPYLETHHVEWLSRGGEDSIDNTVALCPNCHRKMHILDLQEDVVKLKRAATRITVLADSY